MNALAIVAGNIKTMKEVIDYGNCGYDGVVLGRNIAEVGNCFCLFSFLILVCIIRITNTSEATLPTTFRRRINCSFLLTSIVSFYFHFCLTGA